GVCMATSGPGATNLVTGIATAYMDSIPIVAITCNVNVPLLGKDSFQEIDITGITMPITKYNFIVKDVTQLADTLRRAFSIARKDRLGPVLVDVAKDVTAVGSVAEYERVEPELPAHSADEVCEADISRALEMIEKSEKPFLFVGGGAVLSGASEEVRKLAALMDAPVCDTLMGKGGYDGTDSRYVGMLGMHGTKAANLGVSECDLLVAIGTRFSDRVIGNPATFASHAQILQIDIDPAEINKNIQANHAVVGDVKTVLGILNERLGQQEHKVWCAHIADYGKRFPLTYPPTGLSGPYMVEKIYSEAPDAIIVTEVGQHQMWAAQYFKYKNPRTLLSSGGLGTMGYGLGASIGAQIANPGRTVINFAGDGCFRMNMNELATAVRQKLAIIEVIVNNHVLGMVRQWQTLFYEKRYSATVLDDGMDYVKVAEAMGATGRRVTTREEFDAALAEALSCDMPFVIDAVIDSDDKVWPMVAPGAPIDECFDEADYNNKNKD
ncbi:MAG: biosynthetic-type acetolactate synthase large subunit, partial [Clostridiales bacterium]|nr:biosynthetic-type acetolactate synthase large subunit [Clostridiales bacterium]